MEVSVVVPVYNAIQYIEAAVNSILVVPEVAEVVIVDDGSTDGSRELVQRLFANEVRIVLHHHPGNVNKGCLLYTSPSPRDRTRSRMPSSA